MKLFCHIIEGTFLMLKCYILYWIEIGVFRKYRYLSCIYQDRKGQWIFKIIPEIFSIFILASLALLKEPQMKIIAGIFLNILYFSFYARDTFKFNLNSHFFGKRSKRILNKNSQTTRQRYRYKTYNLRDSLTFRQKKSPDLLICR